MGETDGRPDRPGDVLILADLQLSEAVGILEDVDWSTVPTISTAEAAQLTQRLIQARDAARDNRGGPDG